MEPKQKANELVEKFGKKLAIKCVDEIIKEIDFAKIDDTERSLDYEGSYYDYWQDVKQEIKLL